MNLAKPMSPGAQIRLITDFDGPIIDVSERYYRVYHVCLEQSRWDGQTVHPLSKQEFWTLKRSQTSEKEIGILSGLDEAQAHAFSELRYQTIHAKPYFDYDTPAPGAVAALEKVQQLGIDLAVMTMRRHWQLEDAFKRHDLGRFFPQDRCYYIGDDDEKSRDTEDKPWLMERAMAELPVVKDVWVIGDTEADIISAQKHGVKAIGVLSGIRDRAQLAQHQPDFIARDLNEAIDVVLAHSPSYREG